MNVENLKSARKTKNLTQKEVANLLNLNQQRYNHYETGRREPDNEILAQIANVLDVTTDYLLGKTDIKKAEVSINEKPLTLEQQKLLDITLELDDDDILKVIEYTNFIKQQRN